MAGGRPLGPAWRSPTLLRTSRTRRPAAAHHGGPRDRGGLVSANESPTVCAVEGAIGSWKTIWNSAPQPGQAVDRLI